MEKPPKTQCKTCPFRTDGNELDLHENTLTRIKRDLLRGFNHLCHGDRKNQTVCRGGRDWQLEIFFAQGLIDSPTAESLANAMKGMGIKPKKHI